MDRYMYRVTYRESMDVSGADIAYPGAASVSRGRHLKDEYFLIGFGYYMKVVLGYQRYSYREYGYRYHPDTVHGLYKHPSYEYSGSRLSLIMIREQYSDSRQKSLTGIKGG